MDEAQRGFSDRINKIDRIKTPTPNNPVNPVNYVSKTKGMGNGERNRPLRGLSPSIFVNIIGHGVYPFLPSRGHEAAQAWNSTPMVGKERSATATLGFAISKPP